MTKLKPNQFERIERYIEGKSDEDEKAWVESLFLTGEDNSTLRHLLEKDWDRMLSCDSPSNTKPDQLLYQIHHIIRKNEYSEKNNIFQRLTLVYMRTAAILLLPLLIAGGIILNYSGELNNIKTDQVANSSIYAPMGSRVTFNLPDGTTGMLNSGSSLSYSIPFNKNRQITLNGEAWFNVNRDENHPFEINTGTSTLRVLGTTFNISAYPDENYVEVVLEDGKVDYINKELSGNITMAPSERLVFQNGKISKSASDPAKYNAWTEGKLVFRGDPMAEVARRIERWYNVKVVLADKELEKYSFRATFEDDKLQEVLRYLSMTSPIKYQIKDRMLNYDGTYEKEMVTIYLKK
jgi:transmembrane sensor